MSSSAPVWAVVPAAGTGKRMQSDVPKQYLQICGRPVIEHTINRLLSVSQVEGVVVALQEGDPYWSSIKITSDKPVITAPGGNERCHSVMNALAVLVEQSRQAAFNTWALVHDAVRPAVNVGDIEKLIMAVMDTESGGLLAMPVRDTMKRGSNDQGGEDQSVSETVNREGLWHALTPQLFDSVLLREALQQAINDKFLVTDESSAMEHAGYSPRLVYGREDNIKITCPGDLRLAELYMQSAADQTESGDNI